jgi:ferredoxin
VTDVETDTTNGGHDGGRSVADSSGPQPDEPPIAEKPYKLVFEGARCFGAGKCAAVAENWEMDITTGLASPKSYFIDESELDENIEAAEICPAKKGSGVIHVVDRESGKELAPDPEGDGTLSLGAR